MTVQPNRDWIRKLSLLLLTEPEDMARFHRRHFDSATDPSIDQLKRIREVAMVALTAMQEPDQEAAEQIIELWRVLSGETNMTPKTETVPVNAAAHALVASKGASIAREHSPVNSPWAGGAVTHDDTETQAPPTPSPEPLVRKHMTIELEDTLPHDGPQDRPATLPFTKKR